MLAFPGRLLLLLHYLRFLLHRLLLLLHLLHHILLLYHLTLCLLLLLLFLLPTRMKLKNGNKSGERLIRWRFETDAPGCKEGNIDLTVIAIFCKINTLHLFLHKFSSPIWKRIKKVAVDIDFIYDTTFRLMTGREYFEQAII